jgi:hypothetical protein
VFHAAPGQAVGGETLHFNGVQGIQVLKDRVTDQEGGLFQGWGMTGIHALCRLILAGPDSKALAGIWLVFLPASPQILCWSPPHSVTTNSLEMPRGPY